MNTDEPSDVFEVTDPAWRAAKIWLFVVVVSVGLFLLTFDPLLAGTIPYLRAGWPAARTGFWLRAEDPWRARGAVGLCFHLAMAGFRASICGVITVVIGAIIEAQFNRPAELNQMILALVVIMCGCLISFAFGWIGTVIAVRNGIQIFVISNLYRLCRGDFERIVSLQPQKYAAANPATFVMAIAIAVPLFLTWCGLVIALIPNNAQHRDPDWSQSALLACGPLLAIGCIVLLAKLAKWIIARTPQECWGAPIPDQAHSSRSWYQPIEKIADWRSHRT